MRASFEEDAGRATAHTWRRAPHVARDCQKAGGCALGAKRVLLGHVGILLNVGSSRTVRQPMGEGVDRALRTSSEARGAPRWQAGCAKNEGRAYKDGNVLARQAKELRALEKTKEAGRNVPRRAPPPQGWELPPFPPYSLGPFIPFYFSEPYDPDGSVHDKRDVLFWARTVWGNRQHELDALEKATGAGAHISKIPWCDIYDKNYFPYCEEYRGEVATVYRKYQGKRFVGDNDSGWLSAMSCQIDDLHELAVADRWSPDRFADVFAHIVARHRPEEGEGKGAIGGR